MLYSSAYKFVFIKTRKTASSSAELILQALCVAPDTSIGSPPAFGTKMLISDYGIVGARWYTLQKKKPNENMYWSHMPASDIYKKMPELFDESLKISCSRHPIAKYISAFHQFGNYSLFDASILKKEGLLHILKSDFLDYVKNTNLSEKALLSVRGKCCVDYFVRQESFEHDMSRILADLGIDEASRLALIKSAPSAKKRIDSLPNSKKLSLLPLKPQDYLSEEAVELIAATMRWDCEAMGHDMSFC